MIGRMGFIIFVLILSAPASEASSFFIYEGYLTNPDGTAVGATASEDVPFTLKISGKNSVDATTCELYKEVRTVTVKQGQFSIPVGHPSGATVTAPSGMTFTKIFGTANLVGQSSCLFEPTKTGSYRDLNIEIEREGVLIDLGSVVLGESPRATVAGTAEKLGDFQAGNFLRVVENGTPQNLGAWSAANYTKLVDLLSGAQVSGGVVSVTGTSSGFTGALSGDVSGSQAATKVTALQGRAVGDVAPSNGQTLVWSSSQSRWQPGALPTQLPPTGAAGGDLSGTYPNPLLRPGAVSFDKLASGSSADQVLQFNGTTWTAAKLKYTALTNQFNSSPWPTSECQADEALAWSSISDSFVCRAISASLADGSVGRAKIADGAVNDVKISDVSVDKISSATGKYFKYAPNGTICSAGQTLKWSNSRWECANDSVGLGVETDPNVLAFAKSAPSADFTTPSGILTLATVPISKGGTGATTQVAALTALLPAQSGQSGKVLGTNGTTASWVAAATGTVTSVTSANTDIAVATTLTTPVLTLNSGVGANQILKLNSSSQIPGVSGALLTNLNATNLTTGTVGTARLGTGTASSATFLRGDGTWATVPATGLTSLNGLSGGVQTFATPGTTGTAPNWSSATTAHTLHIPMASATGVTAGLISKAQYDAFNSKQAAGNYITALTGDVTAAGPGSAVATIAASAVTTTKIANGAVTDAKIGGMTATKLTGTIEAARMPALTGDVTMAAGTIGTSVVKIQGRSVVSTAPTTNQILKWNGTAWAPADATAGGTVTSVTGTAPISVATGTSTPVISLNGLGVTETHLANNAVTSAKIVDGTIATADLADNSVTNAKILGVTANKVTSASGLYLTYAPNGTACTAGQVLKWSNSRWECGADAGSGTVTTINTGTGLTGGPITTTGTISIADGGVGTTQIANGAVTDAKIGSMIATKLTGTIAAGRMPALTGDVTMPVGTIGTTVVKIQGRAVVATPPVLNQVLKWNGSSWAPAADSAGSDLTGCPSGMTLIAGDPANGLRSFCIHSSDYSGSANYMDAAAWCASEGNDLCSGAQIKHACSTFTTTTLWTSTGMTTSASSSSSVLTAWCTSGAFGKSVTLASTFSTSSSFRCCRR